MAYNEFAYFYDEFNGEADYDALYGYITDELKAHGITDGILADLGCGTGTLTAQLAARGSRVVGVDSARTMVERAKAQYPELAFQVCDALSLPFEGEFDVVFSNAVFHWIADHDTLLENVRKALKPGGQLICEFGGAGNIAAVEQAFNRACEELELAVRAPRFNFPTPEEFSARLARHGLAPVQVYDYDRATVSRGWPTGCGSSSPGSWRLCRNKRGRPCWPAPRSWPARSCGTAATGPLTTAACGLWRENLSNKSVFTK